MFMFVIFCLCLCLILPNKTVLELKGRVPFAIKKECSFPAAAERTFVF